MSEAVNATALGAASIGLPGLMWASDKLGYDVPHALAVTVFVVSGLCLLISIGLWGHLLLRYFKVEIAWPPFGRRIPLHIAARCLYEAAEKAGVVDLMLSPTSSPDSKLQHFKMLMFVDDRVRLFGAKPPSTKSRLIPKNEFKGHDIYPSERDDSILDSIYPNEPPAYVNVTVPRSDLARIIRIYLDEYVTEAKNLRKGRWT